MITENFDNYKTGGSHKEFNIEVVDTDIIIGNANILQESITLDEALCSDNNLKFGCCEASQFSVQVANIFEDFVDKQLSVSVTMDGITTKYGTFKVDSDKPTADRVWRVLTCYDKMKDIINANVIDWFNGLSFPMSQKAYRDSFFEYLGIEQTETSLINDSFMVQGGFTATDTLSGKTIITSICEFNGVFGHINRDGKFDYVSLNKSVINAPSDNTYPSENEYPSTMTTTFEPDFTCPPYENNSVTYEDYETDYITRVTMRGTASDVGTSVGVDGNEYIITNNPIIYGTEGSDELITALTRLLNKIGSISYRPYSVGKTIGNPCVELGDAIIVNTRHQTINSYVIKRTLTGIQALRDKYSATGSKVYPQEVNSIREEISRTQGKMNILTRTVDETVSQLIAIQTTLDNDYLTTNQTQTLISQSASQIQTTVTQSITAELPDMIDEATSDLSDRVTVVESSYTQLSNEIVMKVKADGTVAQVALGASAETGSNVRIKGDNIQLDGNVTITDGFRLTTGVIQSANYTNSGYYETDTVTGITYGSFSDSGTYINLTNGNIASTNLALFDNQLQVKNLEALGYVKSSSLHTGTIESVNGISITNKPYAELSLLVDSGYAINYTDRGVSLFSVDRNGGVYSAASIYAPNLITTSNIGNQSVNYANTAGGLSTGNVRVWTDSEGGNITIYGPNGNQWQIDSFDGSMLRAFTLNSGVYKAAYIDANGNIFSGTGDVYNSVGTSLQEVKNYLANILYGKKLRNYYDSRPSNANIMLGDGSLVHFLATSSMTANKPVDDGHIIHLAWDNTGGWDSQLFVQSGSTPNVQVRSQNAGTWSAWTYLIRGLGVGTSFYAVTAIGKVGDSNNFYAQATSGSYYWGVATWSDSRLKKNIKNSEVNALNIINKIKMREFDFKDESIGTHENIGYVAHELMDVIPEAVMSIPVSEEMKEEYGSDELYQVEDKYIIKYLVKAVQELSAELKQLKAIN